MCQYSALSIGNHANDNTFIKSKALIIFGIILVLWLVIMQLFPNSQLFVSIDMGVKGFEDISCKFCDQGFKYSSWINNISFITSK